MFRNGFSPPRFASQRGFLIPLAAFIVVGLATLAIALNRIISQGATAGYAEGLSTQAFYAAESGAQWGMHQLLFDTSDRVTGDANCAALGTTLNFSVPGLSSCQTTVTCDVSNDTANTTSFYRVISAAQCGSNTLLAERSIEVSAYLQ